MFKKSLCTGWKINSLLKKLDLTYKIDYFAEKEKKKLPYVKKIILISLLMIDKTF